MDSNAGICATSFISLPLSDTTANSTAFTFTKILKRDITIPTFDTSYWESINFAFLLGGDSYYKGLFKRLSYTDFKRSIERGRSNITYTTYSNGVETSNEFYIELEDATIVEKLKIPTLSEVNIQLTQAETTSKRQASSLVGYTADESYLQNPIFLRRHGSTYSPIFREITAFMPDTTLNSEEVKDANCKFNPIANRFFEVKGFEHIKISLKLFLENFNRSFLLYLSNCALLHLLILPWRFGRSASYLGVVRHSSDLTNTQKIS